MINDKKLFSIIYSKKHMFLVVLNTVFLNTRISNYLPHLELRSRSNQIVVETNFVVISNVGIKRFNYMCETKPDYPDSPNYRASAITTFTYKCVGQKSGWGKRRPLRRYFSISQLSTAAYGLTPRVISSHRVTPKAHLKHKPILCQTSCVFYGLLVGRFIGFTRLYVNVLW